MSEAKKYTEADICNAINYALEDYWILWPRNPRFNLQIKVLGWLKVFDHDRQDLEDSGYLDREIEKELRRRQNNLPEYPDT